MWEQHGSTSPVVRLVWRAVVEERGTYTIPGSEFWGISFARDADGLLRAELDGPSLRSRVVNSVPGEHYWGVELAPHVHASGMAKPGALGVTVNLPVNVDQVLIGGRWMAVPDWPGLEDFVAQLVDHGALVADEPVRRALRGNDDGYSRRSWQRRSRDVTGITRKQIEQLERARRAMALLQQGIPAAEVAVRTGYADQAHLTRSLRLVEGTTPSRVVTR